MKVVVALVALPPAAGAELYAHVGETGGGGEGGGGDGGGGKGGADGGRQSPSQSTMYSTYTKLPSYAFSSTASVAVVTKVYVLSGLTGSGTSVAHTKKPRPSTPTPSDGLHLPCTCAPLAVVLTTYSSASS